MAARKDGLTVQPTPVSTLDEAYGIADATTAIAVAAGDRVIGHKIGLTDAAARAVFEAAEPAAEALLAGGALETGAPLTQPGERLGDPTHQDDIVASFRGTGPISVSTVFVRVPLREFPHRARPDPARGRSARQHRPTNSNTDARSGRSGHAGARVARCHCCQGGTAPRAASIES